MSSFFFDFTHSKKAIKPAAAAGEEEDSDNEDGLSDQETSSNTHKLAPLPDTNSAAGVLPRVIKTLVDRRRCVRRLYCYSCFSFCVVHSFVF